MALCQVRKAKVMSMPISANVSQNLSFATRFNFKQDLQFLETQCNKYIYFALYMYVEKKKRKIKKHRTIKLKALLPTG